MHLYSTVYCMNFKFYLVIQHWSLMPLLMLNVYLNMLIVKSKCTFLLSGAFSLILPYYVLHVCKITVKKNETCINIFVMLSLKHN